MAAMMVFKPTPITHSHPRINDWPRSAGPSSYLSQENRATFWALLGLACWLGLSNLLTKPEIMGQHAHDKQTNWRIAEHPSSRKYDSSTPNRLEGGITAPLQQHYRFQIARKLLIFYSWSDHPRNRPGLKLSLFSFSLALLSPVCWIKFHTLKPKAAHLLVLHHLRHHVNQTTSRHQRWIQ